MSIESECIQDVDKEQANIKQSQIPVLSPTNFKRTGSLKLRNETGPICKHDLSPIPAKQLRRHRSLQLLTSPVSIRRTGKHERDDDLDSEKSFGSSCNSLCGHSPFAHNGTTYSARNMKYVFHCSPGGVNEEYMTPTQRANRCINRLRRMLSDTQAELIGKENEVSRLTKELIELRLLKAGDQICVESTCDANDEANFVESALHTNNPRLMDVLPEELDISSVDMLGIGEQTNPTTNMPADNRGLYPQLVHHSPSLADSGNFEDLNCSLAHGLEKELERLRQSYEELREKHNEKVEHLLKIIADANDKYYNLKPKHDLAIIKIKELEKEVETLRTSVTQQEEIRRTLYLQVSKKEKSEQTLSDVEKCVIPMEEKSNETNEKRDLLKNLAVTKKELETVKVMYHRALLESSKSRTGNDAETTLRFLKTAIFYFLTDTTNCKDHLTAIESILEYSEDEKNKIGKVQSWKF